MSFAGAKLVLDTSAYSHFRRNHAALMDALANAVEVCVPAIVIGELTAGFLLGRRTKENEQTLQEFLAEAFVRVIDVGATTGLHYGGIFAALRRAGTPIPTNDLWIAATTISEGGHLLTFDEDFHSVPNLSVTVLQSE